MTPKTTLYYPDLVRRATYSQGKKYTDYRAEIRDDCKLRCVYCDAHENVLGGLEAMQLDHFYPQSLFPERRHDPLNLLWVCNRCNCLKRDDWHPVDIAQINTVKKGYLDPFAVKRSEFFEVESDGTLRAISGPAEYIIKRLKLNRSFLISVRRSRNKVNAFIERVEDYFTTLIKEHEALLLQGAIDHKECQKRIARENAMKEIIMEFIRVFSSI